MAHVSLVFLLQMTHKFTYYGNLLIYTIHVLLFYIIL